MSQAAIAGFVSGAAASGGDFEAALKGAFTAAAFAGVGDLITGTGNFAGTGGIESKVAQISLHGVTGCVTSAASGGKCGPGALSAAFSKAATVYGFTLPREAGAISSAIIGGTASVIGGGKFANGAVTAAAGYLFNECMHTRMCGTDSTSYVRVTANVAADPLGYVNPLTTALHLEIRLVNGYGETVLEGQPMNSMLVTTFNNGAPERGAIGSVVFDTIVPVPAGMSVADFAGRIMNSAMAFQAVPYSFPNIATMRMAPGKYNSNSWVAGVLQSAGANTALVPYEARRQGSRLGFSTPGFESPVPIPGD